MAGTNSCRSPEAFNPKTAAQVEAAYRDNLSRIPTAEDTTAGELSAKSLASKIKDATAGASDINKIGVNDLELIFNAETKQAFANSFEVAEKLFIRSGYAAPTPEQCVQADIDLAALGHAYETMQADALEPEVVLSPILTLSSWRMLYQELTMDTVVNANHRLEDDGLFISQDIVDAWNEFVVPPMDVPVIAPDSTSPLWTLRVIPGVVELVTTSVEHDHNDSAHPSIGEYLTLQAMRLETGRPLIDNHSATWLNAVVVRNSHYTCAPIGSWSCSYSQVVLKTRATDFHHAILGTRLPAWG